MRWISFGGSTSPPRKIWHWRHLEGLNDLLDHRREVTQHLLILIILANIHWIWDFRGTRGRRCGDLLLRGCIIHQGIPEASISIDAEGAEHAIRIKLDLLSWIVTTCYMGIDAMVVEAVASDMWPLSIKVFQKLRSPQIRKELSMPLGENWIY
jgi:hypothetical protein